MNASQINWDAGQEQHHANPLVVVHRLLRGKYVLTLALALVFGLVGGTLGYMSQTPQYRSMGMIQIKPTLPKVLYESEQSTAPKMFSSFVNTQAQLISNGGVIQYAMSSDKWREISPLTDIKTVAEVQSRLSVSPDRRAQEIIAVSFSDKDPRVSKGIVDAVLDSYIEKYGKVSSISIPEITRALEKRKDDLISLRQTNDAMIAKIAEKHNTENLDPLIQNSTLRIRQLELELEQLETQLSAYQQFKEQDSEMSVDEAANSDPLLAEKLARKRELIEARTEMMASEGLREEHRDVRRLTLMIESLTEQIETRVAELKSGGSDAVLVDATGKPIPGEADLQTKIQQVTGLKRREETVSRQLFRDNLELAGLREDRANIRQSLEEVYNRLKTIETESQVEDMKEISGKISIASRPILASAPTSDPRIKMAGVGFIGMGSLPVLAVLALGYFNHRVQYSDDDILSGAGAGIIGMLPDLGNSLADRELASASAFAVHQIRSQLQIKNASSANRVYGVTSPAPGDGKTSMIIAMGLSFAESGNRTLLVDLDFIGRGLSVHFGYPHAPSLAESLTDPQAIDSLVRDTEFEGLQILPAGFGDDERVSRLSPRTVGAMIDHLRGKYDTILIDSGPILGSVEAAFLAPLSDGMLMVVGRGQYKPLVKKAIDQIHAVDGKIIATIFNRASVQELKQSSSSMSVHFSRQFSRQQQEAPQTRSGLRVGPVAGALFSSKPEPGAKPGDVKGADYRGAAKGAES